MAVEHRAAASPENELALELRAVGDALALHVVDDSTEPDGEAPSPAERLLEALAEARAPLSVRELRAACRLRTATVIETLSTLADRGAVLRTPAGYRLPSS